MSLDDPRAHAGAGRPPRRRLGALAALGLAIACGLSSRRYPLPGLLAEYTGDALYTVAVFFACAIVWPARRTTALAVAAFLLSAAVECSQLLSWPWLVRLRSTGPGALVLGQGFQWADLLAYAVGAATAGAIDALLRARRGPRARGPGRP